MKNIIAKIIAIGAAIVGGWLLSIVGIAIIALLLPIADLVIPQTTLSSTIIGIGIVIGGLAIGLVGGISIYYKCKKMMC